MAEIYNQIIPRRLADLHFHPDNPRDHTPEAVERLADSIKEDPDFFNGNPVLLSDRTGEYVVISGEGRCRAAELLGLDEVPTFLFEGLVEEAEIRIMQKANSHTGKWDDAKLHAMAEKWGEAKMKSWAPEVKWATPNSPEVVDDDFDEDKAVVCRAKRGDVFRLGRHRLVCGDSSEEIVVLKAVGGG